MRREAIPLLLGYWKNQMQVMDDLLSRLRIADTSSEEQTVYCAYLLHNLYSALEDLLQEIARTFENRFEDPSQYHRELLKRMTVEVIGIRPEVLGRESFELLDELRAFRHVFRHSYSYALSAERVAQLKQRVLTGWNIVENDLAQFERFLMQELASDNQ